LVNRGNVGLAGTLVFDPAEVVLLHLPLTVEGRGLIDVVVE
jgi:hypothetical protein